MVTHGCTVSHDDNSFAKNSLSYESDVNLGEQRVLGVCWDPVEDQLQFDVKVICTIGQTSQPYQDDNSQYSCKIL